MERPTPYTVRRTPGRLADSIGPVRLTPEVREALERQAAESGRTLSAYLRAVLSRQAAITTRDAEGIHPCR